MPTFKLEGHGKLVEKKRHLNSHQNEKTKTDLPRSNPAEALNLSSRDLNKTKIPFDPKLVSDSLLPN
jgi:hypothetical protein